MKWEGSVRAKLRGCSADQVYPLIEDFFCIHKWMSMVDTCYGVEGMSGQPGCVRYCATTSINGGPRATGAQWALEKLVTVDQIKRCITYEILDSNIGFNSYRATMKVLPLESIDGEEACEMVWSFEVNQVEGWKLEDLISFYDSTLQDITGRMKEALGAAKIN